MTGGTFDQARRRQDELEKDWNGGNSSDGLSPVLKARLVAMQAEAVAAGPEERGRLYHEYLMLSGFAANPQLASMIKLAEKLGLTAKWSKEGTARPGEDELAKLFALNKDALKEMP